MLIVLALGVALVYFTIAAAVIPRISVPRASSRFVLLFRLGAITFFVGCGLTHLHIAVHAFANPEAVRLHELGFHVLQFFGGWVFVYAALRFLHIQVEVKDSVQDQRVAELERLVSRDDLTGAYNRRFFEKALRTAIERQHRNGAPVSAVILDIDNFKVINDGQGHAAGDEVLRQWVRTVSGIIRPSDTLARFGGDEFGLLLPETDSTTALTAAQRIRFAIDQTRTGALAGVTVSSGVASFPEHADGGDELLAGADRALYWSKANGKNRCAVFNDRVSVLEARPRFAAEPALHGGPEAYGWALR